MECPFVDRSFTPTPDFTKPINYKDLGGPVDYVFYDYDVGFGEFAHVQFCKLVGRKRDVFECLNESEWRKCPHFRSEGG